MAPNRTATVSPDPMWPPAQLERPPGRSEGAEGEPGQGGRTQRARGGGRHVAAGGQEGQEEEQGVRMRHLVGSFFGC